MSTSLSISDPVYGTQEITDPCALEIIATPQMQRLKGVNQYGVWDLFNPKYFTPRFEHCVGVYLLLRRLGASREEQLAGLIHDIGHTAFSHVIDYVFDDQAGQTVHEKFHHDIIYKSEIPAILHRHGFAAERVAAERLFALLERDLPELCADRIDYFLRDSLCIGACTQEEINSILNSLVVHDGQIVLTNAAIAEFMARKFMEMNLVFWGPPVQAGSYQLMADILKRALHMQIITADDFFLTDSQLMEKLKNSGDETLLSDLKRFDARNILEATPGDYTFHTTSKARFINPPILQDGTLTTVAERIPSFGEEVRQLKEKYKKGYYIKIVR